VYLGDDMQGVEQQLVRGSGRCPLLDLRLECVERSDDVSLP